jgi:hypothetical protein
MLNWIKRLFGDEVPLKYTSIYSTTSVNPAEFDEIYPSLSNNNYELLGTCSDGSVVIRLHSENAKFIACANVGADYGMGKALIVSAVYKIRGPAYEQSLLEALNIVS